MVIDNFKEINEGLTKILVPKNLDLISKKLTVFYNPLMEINRSLSLLSLLTYFKLYLKNNDFTIALPLAGTGVRGVRFLNEIPKLITYLNLDPIKLKVRFNDLNPNSTEIISQNLITNNILKTENLDYEISQTEANVFLLSSNSNDYIDLDPFGSPNSFLQSSIMRSKHNSLFAVTATDTSNLCGTYIKACRRNYWANPIRNHNMYEVGLRILIRKVQLIASQFNKALTPILSYSQDHYMRVFFKVKNGKTRVDEILKYHGDFIYNGETYGPIWTGKTCDLDYLKTLDQTLDSIHETNSIIFKPVYNKLKKHIERLIDENNSNMLGCYDFHKLCKDLHIDVPSIKNFSKLLEKNNFTFHRTHYNPTSFKSNATLKELQDLLIISNKNEN